MKRKVLIVSLIILVLDQLSKIIVSSFLNYKESIKVIYNFFNITYVYNEGAAWSIFSGKRFLLILIALIGSYFIYKEIGKYKDNKRNIIGFGLLLGGISGNLLDRLFLGYVRDFLDFKIFGYDYPIFNIADSAILIGLIIIIIANIKGEEHGSSSRKKYKSR